MLKSLTSHAAAASVQSWVTSLSHPTHMQLPLCPSHLCSWHLPEHICLFCHSCLLPPGWLEQHFSIGSFLQLPVSVLSADMSAVEVLTACHCISCHVLPPGSSAEPFIGCLRGSGKSSCTIAAWAAACDTSLCWHCSLLFPVTGWFGPALSPVVVTYLQPMHLSFCLSCQQAPATGWTPWDQPAHYISHVGGSLIASMSYEGLLGVYTMMLGESIKIPSFPFLVLYAKLILIGIFQKAIDKYK